MLKVSKYISAAVLTCAITGFSAAYASTPAGFDNAQSAPVSGGPAGFKSQAATSTVADVLRTGVKNQRVVLVGRLTNYVDEDRYTFTDDTGSVTVKLDDDRNWSHIQKDQLIRITGEIHRYKKHFVIDVEDAQPAQ